MAGLLGFENNKPSEPEVRWLDRSRLPSDTVMTLRDTNSGKDGRFAGASGEVEIVFQLLR